MISDVGRSQCCCPQMFRSCPGFCGHFQTFLYDRDIRKCVQRPNAGREGASRPRVGGLPQRFQAFPWTQVAAGNHLADLLMPELQARSCLGVWPQLSLCPLPARTQATNQVSAPLPGFPCPLSLAFCFLLTSLSLSGTPNFLSHPQRAPLASSGKHVSSLGTKRG